MRILRLAAIAALVGGLALPASPVAAQEHAAPEGQRGSEGRAHRFSAGRATSSKIRRRKARVIA